MSLTIHGVDFSTVEEISKDSDQFYQGVISLNKALFQIKDGFDVYFFEEDKADKESFTEKDFYKNKIKRIQKSFEIMHVSMDYKKYIELIERSQNEIIELLSKDDFTEAEINQVRKLINELKLKREFYIESKRMNQFIDDALKHLPSFSREKRILSKYNIKEGAISKISDEPYTIKRISFDNHLYLSTSEKSSRLVYVGYKPFRLCGGGTEEIWSLVDGQWQVSSSRGTWMS